MRNTKGKVQNSKRPIILAFAMLVLLPPCALYIFARARAEVILHGHSAIWSPGRQYVAIFDTASPTHVALARVPTDNIYVTIKLGEVSGGHIVKVAWVSDHSLLITISTNGKWHGSKIKLGVDVTVQYG